MAMGDYKITVGTEIKSVTMHAEVGGYYTYTDTTSNYWNNDELGKITFSPPFNSNDEDIAEIKKELKKLKKKLQNKEIPMKSLYNVVVVSIDEKIILEEIVVANDENEATFNAGVHQVLVDENLKPKDVTIVCTVISSAIRVRKEPQKVIVEKE